MEGTRVRAAAAAATGRDAASSASLPADGGCDANRRTLLPCNAALMREASAFLAQERATDALSAHNASRHSPRRSLANAALAEADGGGERVAYPSSPSAFLPASREKINPCTCSSAAFDSWLRAVVVSIPGTTDTAQTPHTGDHASRGPHTTMSDFTHGKAASRGADAPVTVSREHALYTALELLEAAARLLQRRLALSHGQNRLLQAYYNALEEDIDVNPHETATAVGKELKPTAFHRELRSHKRALPLRHYSDEQTEMEGRLEKVYYVLRKLEEIEGLSNSILIEGREAAHNAAGTHASQQPNDVSPSTTNSEDSSDSESGSSPGVAAEAGASTHASTGAAPSRRLVAIERRVRRMRRQLNLPLAPAAITSRLRNELILSFSARVLALREPAPFTPENHARFSPTSPKSPTATAVPDRHTHSISAFVEWYVQHIMDPPAMSQLLSIVPHEYVVTTSCRLVCACEAHASLRASRALPDLGAVLLRAVTEGRGDAIAQLVLSSSVSYGSALVDPVTNPTCFYAGLVGGQLDVVRRLLDQQCWDAEALHVLLFTGAPWTFASATHGCHAYHKAVASRVGRVVQLAERGLRESESEDSASAAPGGPLRRRSSGSSDMGNNSAASDDNDDNSDWGAETKGRGSRNATAVALAALRDAQLLPNAFVADSGSILQAVRAMLASPAFSAGQPDALPSHSKDVLTDGDSTTASPITGKSMATAFTEAAGTTVTRGALWPPAPYLDGGLQRLRLFLAARNGMLRYESDQQDAQWAALLRQTPNLSSTISRRAAQHGGLGQTVSSLKEDGGATEDATESSFAAVLRHKQLDALCPGSVCPVRCQLCPSFSTPSLQRVDDLSYGPLQPTTTTTPSASASSEAAMEGEAIDGATGACYSVDDSVADDGGADAASFSAAPSPEKGFAGVQSRPICALLLRADTAIEGAPDVWQAYRCRASGTGATPTLPGRDGSFLTAHDNANGEDASPLDRNPWRTSAIHMQSSGSARYSDAFAIEESLQAVQSTKQRRARRSLYGESGLAAAEAAGAINSLRDSASDGDEAGAEADLNGMSRLLSSSNIPLAAVRNADRNVARSVYFEVHLSLNYLLALYDPASPSALPTTKGAAVSSASANSVVVGLCDEALAATANGCTRGPHQPYPVAHLGHTCDPARWNTAPTRVPGSAGVSVSVLAHHSTTSGDAAAEVMYLAVWLHKENTVTPVTSGSTPVYLRVVVAHNVTTSATASSPASQRLDEDVGADAGEATQRRDSTQAAQASATTSILLPTVTLASLSEMRDAVLRCQRGVEAFTSDRSAALLNPAVLVVGFLYTPASDKLRLRLNNYVYPNELNLGLSVSASTDSLSNRGASVRLYPAATLSLDEDGWERWYTHQTTRWTSTRQPRAGGGPAGATGAGGSSRQAAPQTVSNAAVCFAFEPSSLFYGPPLEAGRTVSAAPSSQFTIGTLQKKSGPRRRQGTELVGLLDATCKFYQLLCVLTDVAALAGLAPSLRIQQNLSQSQGQHLHVSAMANATDEVPPGFGEGGLAKTGTSASGVPFFGSRDRRVRDALTRVQELLNAPAAEGALFYPPVRIYRHSSHCPPQELYPLPSSPKESAKAANGEGAEKEERRAGTTAPASSPSMRRQLGAGMGTQPSLTSATAHLYWHEVIPENARLTPLCAALASRQPAMAYAICAHPLTSFCDSSSEAQNRGQQQQRRTALYAACALGYTDVLAVLLERIPAEEILSYFGLMIEGEARAALQQSYVKAEALFLRNYRLNTLSASASSAQSRDARKDATRAGAAHRRCAAKLYGTNECQRPLLDVASIYSTTRSLYTPLHVAMLGVVREADDEASDVDEEDDGADIEAEQRSPDDFSNPHTSSPAHAARGLRRQTACVTLLLNCLYDLLLVAATTGSAAGGGGRVPSGEAKSTVEGFRPASPGGRGFMGEYNGDDGIGGRLPQRSNSAGAELLASALNLQSRAGETALLLAVRHNNCGVATRLLRLGAQAACMDRVTHLFTLELACANRCSPMAETLLNAPSSPYATSPVLLNHAGIATALCWCAINNMHAVLQALLRCDGVDVGIGFEGSSPLHLAISFGSEEAALALLSGTQPKTAASGLATEGGERPMSRRKVKSDSAGVKKSSNITTSKQRQTSPKRLGTAAAHSNACLGENSHIQKPFMDVNVPHERTRCTALHLACERGQLRVIRALLQTWHAQLNIAAANTNYTPLLSALANGRESAALRILEYSKDELRRGRVVLDLTAIDQNGDTALHLAARRGLVLTMEYMLTQFCEEEVTRLAQLHPQLSSSTAFLTATCMAPLHAVNKQGKSALLVAIQYDQADAAEVLVSTLIDYQDDKDNGGSKGQQSGSDEGPGDESAETGKRVHVEGATPPSTMAAGSLFGGALIDGTCMALHQAFKKRLYTAVDLMLSAPSSAALFPSSPAFRESVHQHTEERRGLRLRSARIGNDVNDGDAHGRSAAKARASGQHRSSFVRLLLTRAAGPTISPSDALRLLSSGFVLPELCVYLSDVAAESAVLGVQHGTAMAYADLLMGYLQEHASLVVAPTRMVGFCRDLWACLQGWMLGKLRESLQRQAQESEVKSRKRKHPTGFRGESGADISQSAAARPETASPSAVLRKLAGKTKAEEAQTEPPMVWLCRALLPSAAASATPARGVASSGRPAVDVKTAPMTGTTDSTTASQESWRDAEARKCAEALRSALNRKSLSLDIVRAIRLYGSTAAGTRAIEEIESLVRAYVSAKANARARQMRRQAPTPSNKNKSGNDDNNVAFTTQRRPKTPQTSQTDNEASQSTAAPSTSEVSTTSAGAIIATTEADVYKEIIGNEVLFTTPVGFTVLQLAAALGLSEVVAFLVEKYKLDPLYAPSQELCAEDETDTPASYGKSTSFAQTAAGARASLTRASMLVSASSPLFASLNAAVAAAATALSARDEEEVLLRVLNGYVVRALATLAGPPAKETAGGSAPAAHGTGRAPRMTVGSDGGSSDSSGSGGGDDGDTVNRAWFVWTPFRLAVRTGNVDAVRTLLRSTASAARTLDRQKRKEREEVSMVRGAAARSPRVPFSQIVDFKEPFWVDRLQRTALQERIALIAGTSCSSAGGATPSSSSSLDAAAAPGDAHSRGRVTATLKASADMIAVLLQYGAQPNGLFDSTGSDAWMLALAGGDGGTGAFLHAGGSLGDGKADDSAAAVPPTSLAAGSGVDACLSLLLSFHTPLLGRAPENLSQANGAGVGGAGKLKASAILPNEGPRSSASFDEQLLQSRTTLLRKWKRLGCMRGSSSAATREKLASAKRQHVADAAFVGDAENAMNDAVDEGGFVFDVAEALSKSYTDIAQQDLQPSSPRFASPESDELSISHLDQPSLTSFLAFEQRDGDTTVFSLPAHAMQSASLKRDDTNPLSDNGMLAQSLAEAHYRTKLIAALRLCYRVVLLYLCVDHAPQQLLRLLHVFTLDVIPVRARHPFSGDTVVTWLLRKARERLLTTGSTPTEKEVDDMMSRVVDGISRVDLDDSTDPRSKSDGSGQVMAWSASHQRAYGDPTADPDASVLIRTTLALIHALPLLTLSPDPSACAMLQSLLFQPSYDDETALSLAARLAHVPLISSIVQSAASPSLLDDVANRKTEWSMKRASQNASRRASRAQTDAAAERLISAAPPAEVPPLPLPPFSLATNLTDIMVRVLLATRVYYPAHEITTVRILLHCMPDEPASLAFLRWVYPNIHPLPAMQLAMDHVDVATHFLTSAECMNALWANLLYTHFTRQLDTAVRASSKAWNALLKVVLPGAPAVPIYLVLRGALRTQPEEAVSRPSEAKSRTTSVTSLQSSVSGAAKRRGSTKAKRPELTNWSYLIRRTTIFLQLMAMSVAETLQNKPAVNNNNSNNSNSGNTHTSGSAAAHSALKGVGGGAKKMSWQGHHDGKDAMDGAAAGGAGGAAGSSAAVGPSTSRGLAGTLLLDTLELAVRYDDKEVLMLLMQLRIPEVVIKYVQLMQQQQQQQQAVNASTFPVSLAAQSATARAVESASAVLLSSYPSFAGVRTMTQAGTVLDRLQRMLWREAIQERHLDLIAVLAGAVRTLHCLYTSHNADVAALLTPMRYDRIDLKTGDPEGVVSAQPPHASPPSPQLSPGGHLAASLRSVVSSADQLNSTMGRSDRHFANTAASPPLPLKASPRSLTNQEAEDEQRFADSIRAGGRLVGREERRRRVTTVTWGIGGAACPIELPAGRAGSTSAASVAITTKRASGNEEEEEAVHHDTNAGALLSLPPPPLLLHSLSPPASAVRDDPPFTRRPPPKAAAVPPAAHQRNRKAVVLTEHEKDAAAPRAAVPVLHLPTTQPSSSSTLTPPSREVNPVYFMYLQLDWAMFSTRVLQSPRPSTATVDTILYLLEHRCAVSVPVLDLFLSGLSVASSHIFADASSPSHLFAAGDVAAQRSVTNRSEFNDKGARSTTVELSLRYRTRRHRDTLLHLLVLHDQCQLAEYYLEYCYFFCVSQQLDPEPKNGRPGRFPIHELYSDGQKNHKAVEEDEGGGDRSTTRSRGRSSRADFPHTPVSFLRLMLRVNTHGLTAFDYAHSPAMLQLLEWYGCVPPTYRPNPRLFRRVLSSVDGGSKRRGDGEERGEASPDEVAGWVLATDDDEDDSEEDDVEGDEDTNDHIYYHPDNSDANEALGDGSTRQQLTSVLASRAEVALKQKSRRKKRRELLRFFPVPRLVLASDNFVSLLDPTGAELASTASALTAATEPQDSPPKPAGTTRAEKEEEDDNGEVSKTALQTAKPNRQLSALISTEKRQQQLSQRRRDQQEMAKALLFDQVTAQPLLTAQPGTSSGKGGKSSVRANADDAASAGSSSLRRRGPANPPYLSRVVTANLRERWDAQRHPQVNVNILLHNALEAQRQSFASSVTRWGRDEGRRGPIGGVLPILLSEEVSLLHLGLCTFDDELVNLYGELHASQQHQQLFDTQERPTSTTGAGGEGEAPTQRSASAPGGPTVAPQTQLSAYSRMLLPPVVLGKAVQRDTRDHLLSPNGSVKGQDAQRVKLVARDTGRTTSSVTAGPPASTLPLNGGNGGGGVVDRRTSSLTATPPPRLSYADVVFLLECQEFVVFPLALPSLDDGGIEESSHGAGVPGGSDQSAGVRRTSRRSTAQGDGVGLGRAVADAQGGVVVGDHRSHDVTAVIDRCTGGTGVLGGAGGGGVAGGTRRKNHNHASAAGALSHSQPRGRPRADMQNPATDAPLLRALLVRQAATMSDLVDVAPRRYDTALLISLTPMQLSGIATSGGRGEAGVTMRALTERLTNTQLKQFGSRLVSSSGASAAHVTTETVALLNVPPFSASEAASSPSSPHRAAAAHLATSHEESVTAWDGAATVTAGAASATITSNMVSAHVPTVMAARVEEWVARRWPSQRKPPGKLQRMKKPATETDGAPPPLSVLDRVMPVGGVATTTQQTLMRALLRRFSAATGAMLSEQMGLSVTPNYDVAEVGDAAAARRGMAAKVPSSAPSKTRR